MAFNIPKSTLGSGNLVLIQSQTATNQATVDFTAGISGYDNYLLEIYGVVIDTNNDNVFLQMSTDAGATWNTTLYSQSGVRTYTSNFDAEYFAAGSLVGYLLLNQMLASATYTGFNTVNLINIQSTSAFKQIRGNGGYNLNTYGEATYNTSGYFNSTSIVNGFRILASTGLLVSGTFKLYGVVN